jgi:hypothetical protein
MPVFPSTNSAVIVGGAEARCWLPDVAAEPRAGVNGVKTTNHANEEIARGGYGVCESTVTRGRPLAPSSTESCA